MRTVHRSECPQCGRRTDLEIRFVWVIRRDGERELEGAEIHCPHCPCTRAFAVISTYPHEP